MFPLKKIVIRSHEVGLKFRNEEFVGLLAPGTRWIFDPLRRTRVRVISQRDPWLVDEQLDVIVKSGVLAGKAEVLDLKDYQRGLVWIDGRFVAQLEPGLYAFWNDAADSRIVELDLRESQIDVSVQEIMTFDKDTLRMNALVTYTVTDPRRAVSAATDVRQSLYREVQLALRAVIGGLELDSFLTGKDDEAQELEQQVRAQATVLGLEVSSVGIRDVILPGDMKDLMNRVTEAKKAAAAKLDRSPRGNSSNAQPSQHRQVVG